MRRLEANQQRLELTKGPSNPRCNSRSSPKYPSPLERKHESLAHIQRSPFPPHSSRGRILSLRYPERIPGVLLASQEEAQPQERQEELQGLATIPRVRQMSQAIPGKPVSLHCLDFKLRIDSHHGGTWDSPVGKPRGKASWESLVGMPQGKATYPVIHPKASATLLLQLGRKSNVHAPTRDEV